MTEKVWSGQQDKIFSWFRSGRGNLVVRARAGTGKTTTILEGINHAPEGNILLCAFNKRIAEELTAKLKNPKAKAKTLHGVGNRFVNLNWQGVKLDNERGLRLAKRALAETMGKMEPDRNHTYMVMQLAAKGKGACPFPQPGQLQDLALEFDLVPEEEDARKGFTLEVLERAASKAMDLAATFKDGTIDFDDMIFVPVRNKWYRGWHDLVVVDEAQDMNAAQLILAQGVCKRIGRIVVVGDDRQAIYGFRGADSGSIDRLKSELKATELGLTITYRCPKLVVDMAQKIVPDYQAAPTAPQGTIQEMPYEKVVDVAEAGDFILSRKNAPLASCVLKLLRAGKKAKIEGRETGRQLLNLIKKLGNNRSLTQFVGALDKWCERELEKLAELINEGKKSAEVRADFIRDQYDTIIALTEGLATVQELSDRVASLFQDDAPRHEVVVLSSVHRAKGLEAERVFLIESSFIQSNHIEEKNIRYVAVTRSKNTLVLLQA